MDQRDIDQDILLSENIISLTLKKIPYFDYAKYVFNECITYNKNPAEYLNFIYNIETDNKNQITFSKKTLNCQYNLIFVDYYTFSFQEPTLYLFHNDNIVGSVDNEEKVVLNIIYGKEAYDFYIFYQDCSNYHYKIFTKLKKISYIDNIYTRTFSMIINLTNDTILENNLITFTTKDVYGISYKHNGEKVFLVYNNLNIIEEEYKVYKNVDEFFKFKDDDFSNMFTSLKLD